MSVSEHLAEPTTTARDERAVGELAVVDPATLVIGLNARGEVRLDPHFCRDIADRGVREPITVRRNAEGQLVVRKGQRRTLAALKASRTTVPVLIEPEPDADTSDTEGQIERIIDQYGENVHRAPITEADEARAHQQLLDLGLSAGQIVRRTHVPARRVRAIQAVNASQAARQAVEGVGGYALTIDQAAVLAEFDDGTDHARPAVALLREVAERDPDRFGHATQRLRDERAERQLIAEHAQTLAADGIRVLAAEDTVTATELYLLRPASESPSGTPLTAEEHTSCPGHGIYLTVRKDWTTGTKEIHSEAYCSQPSDHAPRYDRPAAGQPIRALTGEAAGEDLEAERERQRASRRQVIENNKGWDSATTHRRQWLTDFLARRKPPVDAAVFIATTLAVGSHDARRAMEGGQATACTLLKMPEPKPFGGGSSELVQTASSAAGPRALQLALAVLLAAYEDGTSRDSWRRPTRDTIAYFTALRNWNYPLSDVEQLVLETPRTATGSDGTHCVTEPDTGGETLAKPVTDTGVDTG